MPMRYLVLVARSEPAIEPLARQIEGCAGLAIFFSAGRVAVFANEPNAVLPFANDRGAVVGTLFQKGSATQRLTTFEASHDPGRALDPLRVLHERSWGAYITVALTGDEVAVSRDPSGLLPCLYLSNRDFAAFASDAVLLEEAGILAPDIDWPALARLLYANELPQQRLALSGLCDLHAGTSARVDNGTVTVSTVWSPWTKIEADPGQTFDELADELEEVVDTCVESWKAEHRRIAVAVSGGLDSSVVASSLVRNAAVEVTGLTISTDDRRGDESLYAQSLCTHFGLHLIRGRYEIDAADITTSATAHLARPAGRAPALAYEAVVRAEMERLHADALFTGSGGDNVFFSTQSARPLVDRYLAHGLHWGLVSTARDISVLTGASLLSVLRHAARVPRARRSKYHWQGDARFLSEDYRRANAAAPLIHPWLEGPATALPGKTSHLAMILRAQHYLDNYDRRLPFSAVHPLLSQPIVETMLKMPTWFAVQGGRDRAVARKAFSGRFPPLIADRRIKGGPDGFAIQWLRANLAGARERLLDGALVGHGLLDRAAIDIALSEAGLAREHDYVRLLLLLDTEAWVDTWKR
jgi:asparagine synthase (glutamine-hydrolysing)